MNVFAIFFGSIAGLAVGFFAGWLFTDFHWIPNNLTWRIAVGVVLGGPAGGIAGSISGDLNRAGQTGNRFLIAMIFGAIFGTLGATKLAVLGPLLDAVHISNPFDY